MHMNDFDNFFNRVTRSLCIKGGFIVVVCVLFDDADCQSFEGHLYFHDLSPMTIILTLSTFTGRRSSPKRCHKYDVCVCLCDSVFVCVI